MRIGLIAPALALLAAAQPARADSAACGVCHQSIAETYAKTGMARSFRAVNETTPPEAGRAGYTHAASAERFTNLREDGSWLIRREAQSGIVEERVDYAIGSGDHAVSYLHRARDNRLFEFPVSWYSESGGHWGMSPGYDRPDHPGFNREITWRCMFCHNAYPALAPGVTDWNGATVFPARLPEGIDCERCHGPGAAHMEAARQGKPRTRIQAAIVNPARLAPERRMEVCMQCHLETATMTMPVAAVNGGRGVYSYLPGEPLPDYMLYFDPAPGAGRDDRFELVSSAYRLRKSECFRQSAGALTCTTCHNPHEAPSRQVALLKTNRVCAGCHGALPEAHPGDPNCAECHMPRRRGVDAIHITVTDHLIQRPGAAVPQAPAVEEHDGNTIPYAGPVAPWYPQAVDPLDLAIAQVKDLANLPAGLTTLERLLAERRPREAAAWFEMGEALAGAGQTARAIPFYRAARAREPENWRYLHGLGQALQATGRPDLALADLEKAVSLAPYETALLQSLGGAYVALGRFDDAIRTFRDALARNPEDAAAHNNLGRALALGGDAVGAESAFAEAVRLQPESSAMRMNYASELTRNGKLSQAEEQLRQAIAAGPASGSARAAWFARLAATGSATEARQAYDDSLRAQLSAAHNNLGTLYLSRGAFDDATREYRRAAEADPASSLAQLNLGQILLEHGYAEEGREHLRRAAESRDPKIKSAASALLRSP